MIQITNDSTTLLERYIIVNISISCRFFFQIWNKLKWNTVLAKLLNRLPYSREFFGNQERERGKSETDGRTRIGMKNSPSFVLVRRAFSLLIRVARWKRGKLQTGEVTLLLALRSERNWKRELAYKCQEILITSGRKVMEIGNWKTWLRIEAIDRI